jgi:phospholipid/cholesterol/gamma-HCH transport system substrate-binding protein
MSKPVNKKMIGIFVVVAIGLVIAAVLILGSGKFFKKYTKYVMYFGGSVKGLAVGAPVDFRGVKIGTVSEIKMTFNPKELSFTIPVYVEIDPSSVEVVGSTVVDPRIGYRERVREMVKKGLRAQLATQSFVTGQLMISFDFFPDTPAKFIGADSRYPEVPTIPTTLEQLGARLEKIPVDEIVEKLKGSLEGIDKLVNSPEMTQLVRSTAKSVADARTLMRDVDAEIKPIVTDFKDTTQEIRKLAVSATKTSDDAGIALKKAQGAVTNIENLTGDNSVMVYRINKTLGEVENTARSLRILAEDLDRQPQSLIFGKKKVGRD